MPIAHGETFEESSLSPTMRKNFLTLVHLQRLAIDPKEFTSPKNDKKIRRYLQTLADNSGHVVHFLKKKNQRGLLTIGEVYSETVRDFPKSFRTGYKNYVRRQVVGMTGFCVTCHTSQASPKDFQSADKIAKIPSLPPLQRAEFYAATRQFDKAIKVTENFLKVPTDNTDSVRQAMQAARLALNLSVRVKQDPQKSLQITSLILKQDQLPQFFKKDVGQWQKDIRRWMKTKPLSKTASARSHLKRGRQLIEQAQAKQAYPTDHVSDILYLRASYDLQEALKKSEQAAQRAEGLYLLGLSYSALRDPLLWDLDTHYYEACIRELPHSQKAQECYRTLASEVYFGYTGSSGTHIPPAEVKRLEQYRALAESS